MAALYPTKKSFSQAYPELTAQIEETFKVRQQTRTIYEQKDQWRSEMEGIIKELYPSCRLVLSGSSANGFGSTNSDIDLVMCFDGGTRLVGSETLRRIDSLFTRNRHRFETEVIPNARVPIIKLKDREKSFETDISVENWCSLENAFLLRCYSECDPRVKPMVICIKLWAQNARITDAKLKRLAGFAVVLLVIHYLQAGCSPPVLPSLQEMFPELFRSTGSAVIDKLTAADLPIQIRSYKSRNTQSLGELLIGFFRYFSTFNWSRTISIRSGSTRYTSYGKIWSGPSIRLEDPSDGGNVTRSVYDSYEFSRIKRAFNTALEKLQQKPSLEGIV